MTNSQPNQITPLRFYVKYNNFGEFWVLSSMTEKEYRVKSDKANYHLHPDLSIDEILHRYKTRAEARKVLALYKRSIYPFLEIQRNTIGYYVKRFDQYSNWLDCVTPEGNLYFWPAYFQSRAEAKRAIKNYTLKNKYN